MRHFRFYAIMVCLLGLAGCRSESRDSESAAVVDAAVVDAADEGSAPIVAASQPEIDYGDWLRLPQGLEPQFSGRYPTLIQSAQAGDASGQMKLAQLSQQIAASLGRAGKVDEAYQFVLQSARAARSGLPQGGDGLPQVAIGNIFFNEACVLSRTGQAAAATSALSDAIEHGFDSIQSVETDEDLAAVRAEPGYAQQLEQWQQQMTERMMEAVKHDLAEGTPYPFTFAGIDLDGTERSLEALKGQVVIVDFWGTWCPPCRAEIPSFVALQEKYGPQGFQMIGLNYERQESEEVNRKVVADFIQEHGVNYPCLLGDEETRAQVPGFRGYPTTLFIDRKGVVRMQAVGLHQLNYLEAVVSVLLNEAT